MIEFNYSDNDMIKSKKKKKRKCRSTNVVKWHNIVFFKYSQPVHENELLNSFSTCSYCWMAAINDNGKFIFNINKKKKVIR